MRIIDAHVHLWDVDVVPLPWFRDDLGLPRQATAAVLSAELDTAGVSAAVAVQAADSVTEARWLTAITGEDARIRRAVLQYEPSPNLPLGLTGAFFGDSVAGMRAAVPQFAADLSDVAGLDDLAEALSGNVLEVLVRPAQLPGVAALARRHPETSVVVCHLGLGAAIPDPGWFRDLHELAAEPNVHAKASGLVHPSRSEEELRDILAAAHDAFGSDRLMHGSDWPISARAYPYRELQDRFAAALPDASDDAIWAGTAARLYGL